MSRREISITRDDVGIIKVSYDTSFGGGAAITGTDGAKVILTRQEAEDMMTALRFLLDTR